MYHFRVTQPDPLLELSPDEILAVEPGAPPPNAVHICWPRYRAIVPNYGHLAGLLAAQLITPIRGAQLLRLLAGLTPNATPRPRAGRRRMPVRPTRVSASAP